MKIEAKDQEMGRLLVHDDFEQFDSRVNLWAIRENVRDLKETTVTDLTDIPKDIEIKVTFAPPSFFSDVLGGRKNVPYWQVATVIRILRKCDVVFDPRGKMQDWIDQAPLIEWDPEVIELKRQTTNLLLDRMNNRLREDMLADAYIWLIKAAEEAICVPLMKMNAFKVGTATLLLDALKGFDKEIYSFLTNILRISSFSTQKLEDARKELEKLADHLYQLNVKTDREMWILAAFVSINESERRLKQSTVAQGEISKQLFETAVAELWQAYFLVAQNPRKAVKLDPWVVGSFWNHFGFDDLNESWLQEQEKTVREILLY
ncbi:MAG: hypothetical protein JSV04_02085 [Candidatus Heimdallarchaeota archaeon]|nr:MAG: hypothetical protein JSV04_02085 [Candidatus Heimdallarchaeota archaeon]